MPHKYRLELRTVLVLYPAAAAEQLGRVNSRLGYSSAYFTWLLIALPHKR